jgi:hypothetical protein
MPTLPVHFDLYGFCAVNNGDDYAFDELPDDHLPVNCRGCISLP